MGVTRRKFLKSGALWVPCAFAITGRAASKLGIKDPFFTAAILKAAPGAGGCTTTKDQNLTSADSNLNFGNASGREYIASFYVAAATYTLCAFDADIYKVGSPTFDITPQIFSHSVNKPGVSLSSGTLVGAASLPGSAGTLFKFSGLSIAIVSGVTYWLVLQCSTFDAGGNHLRWDSDSTAAFPGYTMMQLSADAVTWSVGSNIQGRFRTYA
jgi:hypothetical protein